MGIYTLFLLLLTAVVAAESIVTPDLGCFSDTGEVLPDNRWLNNRGGFPMTIFSCLNHCRKVNKVFAGVSKGKSCYCGNAFPNQGAAEGCTIKCIGRDEICGGNEAVNVYTVCHNGTYKSGTWNCNNNCGHCKDGVPCHQITGICTNGCANGYFGTKCSNSCEHCKENNCNEINGFCLNGCKPGWQGGDCSFACTNGFYGNCSQPCGNCKDAVCNKVTGECSIRGCHAGWKGSMCLTACEEGKYGEQCLQSCDNCKGDNCLNTNGRCRTGCKTGYTGDYCRNACEQGKYGDQCLDSCNTCAENTCVNTDGRCTNGCTPGYTGDFCRNACEQGKYGDQCLDSCNTCDENKCENTDGRCTKGCKPGYTGDYCKTVCETGKYGDQCLESCNTCDENTCNNTDGRCTNGCKPGYTGDYCRDVCEQGKYGDQCLLSCMNTCANDTCEITNGTCTKGCKPGYTGDYCNNACISGMYGNRCLESCGTCTNSSCEHTNGRCTDGCKPGYAGDYCGSSCTEGTFGYGCSEECGHCKDKCKADTGYCLGGCEPGYLEEMCKEECFPGTFGANCTEKCKCQNVNNTCHHEDGTCLVYKGLPRGGNENSQASLLIGSVVGTVFLIAVCGIIIGVILLMRRRKSKGEDDPKKRVFGHKGYDSASNGENEYAEVGNGNVLKITENGNFAKSALPPIGARAKQNTCFVEENQDTPKIPPKIWKQNSSESPKIKGKLNSQKIPPIRENNVNVQVITKPDPADTPKNMEKSKVPPSDEDQYMNTQQVLTFRLNELREYVKRKQQEREGFLTEFRTVGVPKYSAEAAADPMNKKKNRFRDKFPYDHCRVHLKDAPNGPNSDYINASHINGFANAKKFIATQGPKKTSGDFWTMVWEQNVTRIVMVTNCFEGSVEKCDKYWPDVGKQEKIDNFVVKNINETKCSEFLVRTLGIDMAENDTAIYNNMEATERQVLQFHYTEWPDKGVPRYGTGLLKFLRRVRAESQKINSPTVVHCSAGVGRTGTYIALDCLFDQFESEGQIDVFTCVKTLREQRMTMVQTVDQYSFVYESMYEAMMVGDTHTRCHTFTERHSKMKEIGQGQERSGLEAQYTMLQEAAQKQIRERRVEAAKHTQNEGKNRSQAVLPDDSIRVLLMTEVPNRNNYINAVFSQSYKKSNDTILTQLPLEDTAVDFWRMVKDYNVNTVVMLSNCKDKDFLNAEYWPSDVADRLMCGPFTVKRQEVMKEGTIICCHLEVAYKDESKPLFLVGVTDWPDDKWKPGNANTLSYLYNKVQDWREGHKDGKMIIQCSDGGMKSGMYAVVSWMFNMMYEEGVVDIFQITKEILPARPEFLIRLEQYKDLYNIAEDYLKNFQTYSNMQ